MGVATTPYGVAQTIPFKTKGSGYYNPATGDYGGDGVGTLVGRHHFLGNVLTFPTGNPFVYDFMILPSNPQETVAANGDKIYFSGSGQVELFPLDPYFIEFTATWSGNFVVEGGTGRFASIAPGPQPLDVIAINDPFTLADPQWDFTWTLNGSVRLR